MELNLQKQTVSVNETVYDGSVEQPLECDVLLPDYCPDIARIISAEGCVYLHGAERISRG